MAITISKKSNSTHWRRIARKIEHQHFGFGQAFLMAFPARQRNRHPAHAQLADVGASDHETVGVYRIARLGTTPRHLVHGGQRQVRQALPWNRCDNRFLFRIQLTRNGLVPVQIALRRRGIPSIPNSEVSPRCAASIILSTYAGAWAVGLPIRSR